MVDSIVNGSDIIESIHVEQDYELPKITHNYSAEIFERDELWTEYNIVQQVDVSHSNKTSSGVWKYFGRLHHDNRIVDEGYFYCINCYANRVTKKYQTNTSTGNLIKHMFRAHNIELEQPMYRIRRDADSYTIIKEESMTGKIDSSSEDVYCVDLNEILIDEVHKRPQLFDPKLCHKNKHKIRQSLWLQVYETMNHLIPLERLPKIWKNIRDRYQKVRRSCEGNEYKVPKYRYYDRLRFLDSVIDTSINKTIQSALMQMDDSEGKEKDSYYEEDKHEDELFEVLELDVDEMENEEVSQGNIDETAEGEENVEGNVEVKCEGSSNGQRYLSEINETHELSHYEVQDSEADEQELFTIDNSMTEDVQPPAKRMRIDIPYEQTELVSSTPSKPDVIDKAPALCEFEIFGNYVAAVMKNMRKTDARQLQMKIVQLINSYDEDETV